MKRSVAAKAGDQHQRSEANSIELWQMRKRVGKENSRSFSFTTKAVRWEKRIKSAAIAVLALCVIFAEICTAQRVRSHHNLFQYLF